MLIFTESIGQTILYTIEKLNQGKANSRALDGYKADNSALKIDGMGYLVEFVSE